mmetsp:Transcript_4931/g.15866  ORF Transcript_4931/g.15866 Transcript_4931/m.15866 type:complete len:496 (-) Transcript_4931:248-1735(-)
MRLRKQNDVPDGLAADFAERCDLRRLLVVDARGGADLLPLADQEPIQAVISARLGDVRVDPREFEAQELRFVCSGDNGWPRPREPPTVEAHWNAVNRRPAAISVVLEQRVHDRAAVPKRAHAAGAEPARLRVARRRGRQLGRKRARDAVERLHHVRVDGAQLAVRWRHPVTHTDRQPQQTRDARCWLGVTAVRLDAPHRERLVVLPPRVQRGERARLDRVAQRRARAVSLHASHLVAQHRGVGERGPQQRPLRLAVGRRQARALAVLPHAAADQSQRVVRGKAADAQRRGAARLATHVPVRARVEGVAVAAGGEHAGGGEGDADAGEEHHAHTDRERGDALAVLERAQRRVVRRQRRRARGVVRHARALHPEHKRDAPGGDRVAAARRSVHAARERRRRPHDLREVVRRDAQEDAGDQVHQGGPLERRAVQRLERTLEEQPLLGVHRPRLGRRHAEERVVEELRVAQEAAVPGALADHAIREAWPADPPALERHL